MPRPMSILQTIPRRPVPLIACVLLGIASCGGGGGDGGLTGTSGAAGWTPGVFQPAASFRHRCAAPRSGTNPATGQPYPDVAGSRTDENHFLRSYSFDTYLWYDELVDRNPALYTTPEYFDLLRTTAVTASGAPRDRFHFTIPSDEWLRFSQSGANAGYGAQFAVLSAQPPRQVVVAYTDPGTPADAAGIVRGTEILEVDGVDVVNGGDADALNAGLFPTGSGETHTFRLREPGGAERTVSLTSAIVTTSPVQNVSTLQTSSGAVGYLLFNDHIATAEAALVDAVNQFAAANISDLVIDVRYNGGGFLYIASEFAYMIAGQAATAGRVFEVMRFNDKHPNVNPVTGQAISPLPFYDDDSSGQPLPSLNLSRVFVLTGPGTCSASESIINGLRGVGIEVIQVGSTTCGKPYGFYPTDNCGTTYFTIQFRGENEQGFGDYADGFSPQNAPIQTTVLPGCQVADDFSASLGDPAEQRLAAALQYRETGTCPSPTAGSVPGVSKPGPGATAASEPQLLRAPWREIRLLEQR